jgi:hypothetical protein
VVTAIDLQNNKISGTFNFDGECGGATGHLIHTTNGVFSDIHF